MEIKWYQLLFQIINFGILVFLLNRFLYRPIIKIIELRNKKIADSIKAAEDTLKEKSTIEALKRLAEAEAEKKAVEIVERAQKRAGVEAKEIVASAREAADLEVGKKMAAATGELEAQEKAIAGRLSDLVVKTTAKILKDSLSDKEQKAIIAAQIKKLSKVK